MPGIMYHLAFAEEVHRHIKRDVDDVQFFSGNLIPDLVLDKKASHYRIPASVEGFYVPDMKVVRAELYDKNDPIKLGIFCHLYLDYHFIENYIIPEFIWDADEMLVINPRNGKNWSVERFFAKPSKGGILYNGYTQINKLMVSDGHINMETVKMLPEVLPDTGIDIFDARRDETWLEELSGYLSENVSYTGEALDYERLWKSISLIAKKFVEEEL